MFTIPHWDWWPAEYLHAGCGWGEANDFSKTDREDWATRWTQDLEEESTAAHTPDSPEALEPERTGSSGELVISWRWLQPAPPGFTRSWVDKSDTSPLEDTDSLVSIPLGAWLDISSLGSMHVIISHNPMMGEVQYQYQSRVISWMSLQMAPSKSSDQPNSNCQLEEPLANRPLLNLWMSFKLSEYPFLKLSRT